ncbi:MAG: amidohydrolase [Synergistes sp.]|nr:amidohydrolase [Synergistes sp.]
MKRKLLFMVCVALMPFILCGCGGSSDGNAADTVLYGNVVTMDKDNPLCKAVAVKNGTIVFAGTKDEVKKYIGAKTTSIDYGENFIYPGFVDGHSHIGLLATLLCNGLQLQAADSLTENAAKMKEFIEKNPGKEVYKGFGFWYMADSKDQGISLDHSVFDRASTTDPIVCVDGGGHSALLNKAAIEHFKLKDKIETYGTDGIKVDANGEPTGYIVETPRFDIVESLPISKEDLKQHILDNQEDYISRGYTTICEAGILETKALPMVSAYKELAQEKKLKLKIRALCQISETTEEPLKEVERIISLAKQCNDEYFKIIGIKIFVDGVPEALTSWTNNPYVSADGKPEGYCGYKRWTDKNKDTFTEIVKKANKNGLLVHAHAMGEGAVRYVTDRFAEARKGMPDKDYRNGFAHVSFIEDDDMSRLKENKISVFLAPQWAAWKDDTKGDETKIYGEDKAKEMYKIKSFIDKGVTVSFHTDGSGTVPKMIYCAVTRDYPDKTLHPKVRGENEKVSPDEALKCLSVVPAYTMKEQDNIGCIKKGMRADFAVYKADFRDKDTVASLDCTELPLSVFSSGKVVYTPDK